ncbi:MAG: alpha/beta fold hydrolase [Thermomicrobiales bacterium]
MPHVNRPDGARIYYEVHGQGTPLLLFAPGGISSQISFWASSALNPFDFADEFMVIGMDQRNAEHSPRCSLPPPGRTTSRTKSPFSMRSASSAPYSGAAASAWRMCSASSRKRLTG